tara:strand:+ start:207 stop:944 length:738 start_codon:yes stop_codon:yes gene_type:complete
MKIEKVKISELNPAEYNPRRMTNKQYEDLKNSLEKFGCTIPIVINSDKTIIGGHQRVRIMREMGAELVPVVRVNLSKEDEKELNIRLNKNSGEFDLDVLANNFEVDELKDWGFKDIELGFNIDKIEEKEEAYTKKIEAPIYEPKGEKPMVKDLYNEQKSLELLKKIKKSKVSNAEKEFLIMATFRHVVFNYSKIAEYYAQSNKEMQELMEDSALVIIDFNKAIENGFVNLSNEIRKQYLKDNSNE